MKRNGKPHVLKACCLIYYIFIKKKPADETAAPSILL